MSNTTQAMTAIEKATKNLLKASTDATKIQQELGLVCSIIPETMEEIQLVQGKLNTIQEEYDEKFRKAKVDLNGKLLENEEKVLTDILKKRGLAHISEEQVAALKAELETVKESNEAEVTKAVAIAKNQVKSEFEKQILESESEWKVEKAELVAQEKAAQQKVEMLTAQITGLQETITEERKARIEIAASEASKQATIINTSSK